MSSPKGQFKSIGCIGLGTMGAPIARRLQQNGYALTLYARRPEVFEGELADLIKNGAQIASTPQDLAEAVDVILVNVMAGADSRDVLLAREDAAAKSSREGLIILDHSTIDPADAKSIHQDLKTLGHHYIDAPVSGGSIGAEAGTLVTMMGGNAEQIAQVTSILECYTASRLHMGDAGTGQVAKLCNQIAQVVTIQGIGEAMSFAETQGADKQKVFDVMSSGFAASRMLELLGPKMVADDFTPLMKSKLLDKDIDIALTSSQGAGLDLPALKLVRDAIAVMQEKGWHDDDISSLFRLVRK